jgi:predicted dehydrogenase
MTLRWAILGTSFISHTVAQAIASSPGSEATVVMGRDPERLAAFQTQYGIAHAVTSLDEAVAHPEVDAVYVGLPNHVHHIAVAAAARAGKAVLSEKSLTVTTDQADELIAAVRGKVFFVEGLMYLAHPLIARFFEVLTDGRLGELRAIHASYAANIAHLVNPAGGGAIFNLGCYPMSLTQLVIDTVEGEAMFAGSTFTAFGTVSPTDDNVCEATALVQTHGGKIASVHTSETYGMAWSFSVQGTKGVLRFVSNPWLPERGINTFEWAPYDGRVETFTVDDPLDAFDHQIRLVERAVAAGQLEAARPSPRLNDSRSLLNSLVTWESLARQD